MQIDCYGFEATSYWFKRRTLELNMFMHVDDVLYLRYSAAEVGPVHRIDRGANGELRTMWAYGAWVSEWWEAKMKSLRMAFLSLFAGRCVGLWVVCELRENGEGNAPESDSLGGQVGRRPIATRCASTRETFAHCA